MNNTDIKLVSVVIPVYNEEASLPALLSRVTAACDQLSQDYEVILIDDGSHDGSTELIRDAAAVEGSKLVGVLLNRNYGQHAAIMAGFETAKGDLVITLDADLQNPPEEIPRLVEAAMQGYDVVGTMRRNRQDSWFRKTASKLINKSVQKATG
ncbi:glycosyltransferase, partial [Aeromonas hydrophila]|uniref:glycosyltransferase n=2 Tax=Aeromonadaceae TaxID=84642 RepID=UPI0021AA91BE